MADGLLYQIDKNNHSWNDKEPKYDLREWDSAHEKMGKGMPLVEEELRET
jgi:hypothetical protein